MSRATTTVSRSKVGRLLVAGPRRTARAERLCRRAAVPATLGLFPLAERCARSTTACSALAFLGSTSSTFTISIAIPTVRAYARRFDEVLTGAVPALIELREAGTIRRLRPRRQRLASLRRRCRRVDLDIVLLAGRYTLLDQSALSELLPVCERRGVALVIGGPYNSGILATGAHPADGSAPYFNYAPAPPDLVARVAAIERVCAEFDVPLQRGGAAVSARASGRRHASFRERARSPNSTRISRLRTVRCRRHSGRRCADRGLIAPDAPLPARQIVMRVDAHHHVWRLSRGDYGWLQPTPELAPIHRDFMLRELRPLLRAANVGATGAGAGGADGRPRRSFLLEVASASGGLVRGVVGWVDLGGRRCGRGARRARGRSAAQERAADAAGPARSGVDRSARRAARARRVADAGLALRCAGDAARSCKPLLADARPSSGPGGRHRSLRQARHRRATHGQPWADDLAAIARLRSACCKLSGLVTEAGRGLERRCAAPLRRRMCSTCFGSERVIWGSDWPVRHARGELCRDGSPRPRRCSRG